MSSIGILTSNNENNNNNKRKFSNEDYISELIKEEDLLKKKIKQDEENFITKSSINSSNTNSTTNSNPSESKDSITLSPSSSPNSSSSNSISSNSDNISTNSSPSIHSTTTRQQDSRERVEDIFSKVRHNKYKQVLEEILGKRFSLHSVDGNGNNIFHVCAENNQKKLLRRIIKQSEEYFNINQLNSKNQTPLDISLIYEFHELANWLKSLGAKRNKEL